MVRCLLFITPQGWGWVPLERLPQPLRDEFPEALEVDWDEVRRLGVTKADGGLQGDYLARFGHLPIPLALQKVGPEEVDKFFAAQGPEGPNVESYLELWVHEAVGNRRLLIHSLLSHDELADCASL
jgi:hypothetical protein